MRCCRFGDDSNGNGDDEMCVERPVLQDGAYLVDGVGDDRVWMLVMIRLGEDPFRLTPPTFGHCPNSDWTPPPHSTGHSGALFFGPFFTILQGCMLPKTVSAPNHLGKRLDPPKNKDMPI